MSSADRSAVAEEEREERASASGKSAKAGAVKSGKKPAVSSEADAGKAPDEAGEAGARPAQQDPSGILGAAAWLMLSSPGHKHLFVADFEWLVVPPIMAKQFRLYRRDGVPVGFVSWARLTEDAEKRIATGAVKLAPKEWTEGDRLWIIDVIAPFGGIKDIMADLKTVFGDETAKYIQAGKDGRRVEELK